MNAPIRVLLVDDHEVVREGLSSALKNAPGIDVVGECGDGKDAIRMVRSLQPDIVLMDIEMPDLDGIQAAQIIHAQYPNTRVIMLTTFADQSLIQQARAAGASGYLLKTASLNTIINKLRAAFGGEEVLSPEVEQVLTHALPAQDYGLTEREMRILRLMVEGLSNVEIAEQVAYSRATVKADVSAILDKLNVKSRVEAVALALKTGLIQGH